MNTQRILSFRAFIRKLNHGVRERKLYEYAAESLRKTQGEPPQIRRAKAFRHILERTPLLTLPEELIAGTMLGQIPFYESVPGSDEQKKICCRTLDSYLSRKKSGCAEETVCFPEGHIKSYAEQMSSSCTRWSLMARVYQDLSIPFRDLQEMIGDMKLRYAPAGLEPYEIGRELERAFVIPYDPEDRLLFEELPYFIGNHLCLNYERVLKTGLGALRDEILSRLRAAKESRQCEKEYYEAALIAAEASMAFIRRYAAAVKEEAYAGTPALFRTDRYCSPDMEISYGVLTEDRRQELLKIAEILHKVSEAPAESFYEAAQLTWMLHIIANIQGGSALSLGRIDQYLYPYYEKDRASGIITEQEVREILSCIFLKVNEPRMRTIESVTLGGTDRKGNDAANALTRLCLQVIKDLRMPYPNAGLRIHEGSPDWVYDMAVSSIGAGTGQPMLLNDRIWVPALLKLGIPGEDARNYYNMGCVEILVPGKQPSYGFCSTIAFPSFISEVLEESLLPGSRIDTFEAFMEAYRTRLENAMEQCCREALKSKAQMRGRVFDPYSSLLIDGCIEKGRDMLQGGAELPGVWAFYACGIGTAADALYALKKTVFDEGSLTLRKLTDVLNADFKDQESVRRKLTESGQHYGNNQDEVDSIAMRILRYFTCTADSLNREYKDSPALCGDRFVTSLFSYFFHIYLGEIAGATPDGRKKGRPFSDSMGPVQGRDKNGPTRLFNSILSLDNKEITGAFSLNFRMNPAYFESTEDQTAVRMLLKTYMDCGGPQIQIYPAGDEELQDAIEHPERHEDLIVGVGGYCEFFNELDRTLQEEILSRTMYGDTNGAL